MPTQINSAGIVFPDGTTQTTASIGVAVQPLTVDGSGTGQASPFVYNGTTASTISFNTIGSPGVNGTNATGTWPISITGTAGSVPNAVLTTGTYFNPSWITGVDYSVLNGTVPTWNQNTTGNAATVTNGVYTTGAYLNPAWITGLPYSKLTGTVPTWNQSTTGNAATVTNGVYTTGTYNNPSWITGLAYSKLTGTVPTWNQNTTGNAGTVTNGVYTTDTGTVTNLMLAGSIANSKLLNSTVNINGTSVALGGAATITAETPFPLTTGSGFVADTFDGSVPVTIDLSDTGVVAGTYGSSTTIPTIAIDSQGRITSAVDTISAAITYQGTWNAATNTPSLSNGTGLPGQYYICNVAGTANFGAGAVTYGVGDWVVYDGTVWQKVNNSQTTSVANFTITGIPANNILLGGGSSPIKALGFGTAGQVLQTNGTGNAPTWVNPTGSTTNAATFNNSGAGSVSPVTFNGSVARTISYNTIGAPSTTGANATGTWNIDISGNAATTTSIKGGLAGSLPYQTAVNATSLLAVGTTGQVLSVSAGGLPTWSTPTVTGDVVGPSSATDLAITRYDGTTGKLIQNSTVTLDDTANISGVLSEQFADGTAVTLAAGKQWYNGTTGSWNLGMGGGNITQQVGEEIFVYGKASAAISDSPLQIVYQTGQVGASGVITFAPTIAGLTDGNRIIGVATESIALNGTGRITSFGVIRGITTNGSAYGETWVDGDEIWYDATTGNPTNIKPSAPNLKVSVGTIINAGPGSSGSIQVEVNHGSVLGGTDSNVEISAPANNQVLKYDNALGYWKNANAAAAPVGSVQYNVAGSFAGNSDLTYDGTTLTAVNDAVVNSLTVGQGLTSGRQSTALGVASLVSNVGVNNVAVGYQSLQNNTAGSANVAIGANAQQSGVNNSDCVAIGNQALQIGTGNSDCIAIGTQTLQNATASGGSVAIGLTSMSAATNASYCVGIGGSSLISATTTNNDIAIGYAALYSATTPSSNTVVGSNGGAALTTATSNVLIGAFVASSSTSLNNSVIIGYAAGVVNNADNVTLVGTNAGASNVTAAGLTAVGYQAFFNNDITGTGTAAGNTGLGYQAALTNQSGSRLTAVGYQALRAGGTGSGNTAIGYQAGLSITGSNNTILGAYTGAAAPISTTGSNFIVLSDGAGNVNQYIDNNKNAVFAGTVRTAGYTVGTLPAGVTGMRAHVTDANATTFYSTVAGGGTNVVPVFYNGTNWVIA